MELIFTKQADRWVAEFIATADFNLHIEGVVEGNVSVFQRGSESGNYAFVKEGTPHPSYANVYDYDFAALIYPKFIKVSCATEPTSGIVTSDGEITEIKAQSKEIEVTSNGTINVTPDAGFAYLNSVKVKTNVAQSGEGSGGVGYLYFENVPPMVEPLMFSSLINDGTRIIPSFLCGFNSQGKEENITVHKIAAMYGYTFDGMKITEDFLREFMSIGGIVEITKEEFYNLDNGGE